MFNNLFQEFQGYINDFNNNRFEEPPYLPFTFEYLVDCLDHSEYKTYNELLNKYNELTNFIYTNDITYYLNSIKVVKGWEMNNIYYDSYNDELDSSEYNSLYNDELYSSEYNSLYNSFNIDSGYNSF